MTRPLEGSFGPYEYSKCTIFQYIEWHSDKPGDRAYGSTLLKNVFGEEYYQLTKAKFNTVEVIPTYNASSSSA